MNTNKLKSNSKMFLPIIGLSFLILSFTNIFAKTDIKVFNNRNKATVDDLPIKVETQFSVNYETDIDDIFIKEITSLKEDNKGHVYILDKSETKVYIFDKNMKLIQKFGNKGNGPGEMQDPYNLLIMDNHIYISDAALKKNLKFNLNGKFIKDIIPKNGQLPQSSKNVSNDKFVAILWNFYEEDKKLFMKYEVTLLNKEFEKLKTLNSITKEYDPKNYDSEDFVTRFTVSDNEIFVAEIDESNYKINIFDFDGNLKSYIKKNYRKIKYNNKESKDYQERIMQFTNGMTTVDLSKIKYKKAIRGLYFDKSNKYLIVRKATERDPSTQYDFIVDIFKDGVFLKEVNFTKDYESFYKEAESNLYVIFINNSFYAIDEDNMIINKYKLKQ